MGVPKFIAIWRHQWMLEDGVQRLESENALLMRGDRLEHDFNLAAKLGYERGLEEGAWNLRKEIEDGEVTIAVNRSAAK